MNLNNTLKKITFGCGLATLCFSFQASAYYGDDCCQPSYCAEGPLSCGAWGVQVKGGVTPSWFSSQERTTIVLLTDDDLTSSGPKGPRFDKIFNTPWQVGAELDWNASSNVQFFAEYAYVNASSKKHSFAFSEGTFTHRHRNFQTNGFYLGGRYFFGNLWGDQCCGMGTISPFIGIKGGLVWNANTRGRASMDLDSGATVDLGSRNLFRNDPLMSAGIQIGLDWAINSNWGVVFTVEAVGVQSFRANVDFVEVTGDTTALVHLGSAAQIVEVPVTLGLRYTF